MKPWNVCDEELADTMLQERLRRIKHCSYCGERPVVVWKPRRACATCRDLPRLDEPAILRATTK